MVARALVRVAELYWPMVCRGEGEDAELCELRTSSPASILQTSDSFKTSQITGEQVGS